MTSHTPCMFYLVRGEGTGRHAKKSLLDTVSFEHETFGTEVELFAPRMPGPHDLQIFCVSWGGEECRVKLP